MRKYTEICRRCGRILLVSFAMVSLVSIFTGCDQSALINKAQQAYDKGDFNAVENMLTKEIIDKQIVIRDQKSKAQELVVKARAGQKILEEKRQEQQKKEESEFYALLKMTYLTEKIAGTDSPEMREEALTEYVGILMPFVVDGPPQCMESLPQHVLTMSQNAAQSDRLVLLQELLQR